MSAIGKFFIRSAAGKLSSEGAESDPYDEFPSPNFNNDLFSDNSSMIIFVKSTGSQSSSTSEF